MTDKFKITELLDIYGQLLTKRQKQLTEDYYNFDLSLCEIADNYGITRQAVRDTLKSAEKLLLRYENILRLRYLKLQIAKASNESLLIEERLKIIKDANLLF